MDQLRSVKLEGRAGNYVLTTWDSGRVDGRGQTRIRYELVDPHGHLLFEGDDFAGSPMHADDADETVRALLGFLTLRPGDTDAEYFASYTPEQLAFAEGEAEELSLYADEDGPPLHKARTRGHRRGGKGRAARGGGGVDAAFAALGAAIRRARGGYSQEVHEAQDALYDLGAPAADVDAFEDRVRHGLLAHRDPAVRRTTRAFVEQLRATQRAIGRGGKARTARGARRAAPDLADAVRKLVR